MLDIFEKLKSKGITFEKKMETPFSILSILHDEIYRKEVTHSKILKNLLSPENNHGYKNALIDSFLKEIGVDNFEANLITNLIISTEFGIDGRFIDLLITWKDDYGKKAVIVENKLNYASDQTDQLNDYYDSICKIYQVEKIVYMPISPYKSAKHTDAREDVLKKTIDFSIVRLIKWLNDCIEELVNSEQIYHLIVYRDLLKIMLTNHYNLMKAEEIQAKLLPDDISKLIDLASIVNAKHFKLKETIAKAKIKEPTINFKGQVAEFYYQAYEYWVELWSYERHTEFFICSYTHHANIKINGITFNYHSFEKERYYYKAAEQQFARFNYPYEFDALGEVLYIVLKELSDYEEEKSIVGSIVL